MALFVIFVALCEFREVLKLLLSEIDQPAHLFGYSPAIAASACASHLTKLLIAKTTA
jgi:hypothetical protein